MSSIRDLIPLGSAARISVTFGAVANAWFVVLWSRGREEELATRAVRDEALWLLLLASAALSIALVVFGAMINDVLDMKRDRTLHPDRPLPAGAVSVESGVLVVTCALILAVLGATAFGVSAVILTLLVAAALLFFNAVARFIPGVGVVVLGLIFAGHTLVPNHRLIFVVPVWLILVHALAVAGVAHVVSRRTPRLSTRAILAAVAGLVFWSVVLGAVAVLRSSEGRVWPEWLAPALAIWPGAGVLVFIAVAWNKVTRAKSPEHAADKAWRYGALWLTLYPVFWFAGTGDVRAMLIAGSLAAAGFGAMTVIREAQGLRDHPLGYRL